MVEDAKSRINQRKAAKAKMPPAGEELGMQRMRKVKAKTPPKAAKTNKKPKSQEAAKPKSQSKKPKSQEAKKPKAKKHHKSIGSRDGGLYT